MLKKFDYEKTPIVEIVNEILVDSTKRGASDIHFDPYEEYVKCRIRIDGELTDYTEIPSLVAKNLITRVKIISGMNITESRLPQDGAIKATLSDINLDLRVSSLPTNKGEKIVIRILDYSMSLAGLESLGLSDENFKKVIKMISEPNGIILVTGATGTGKSTTVYSILQRLNKENTNIISVEDPIEMDIDGINQIQTNSEIGLDFATVLRSILRQDPNIIMIGEIRDTETAKIAVRASITGHLVLSTIHTNDSLNTIERLLDMEVERYLLASALTGIISQKLARKLCPHCKQVRPTNDYEKDIIKRVTGKDVNEIYSAVGCDECNNGYNGRIAIHEVLLIDQDIKDAISSNVRKDKLRKLVYNENIISLLEDGISKVLEGLTTLEELLKIIELDDDNKIRPTGLQNAIDANELTQHEEESKSNEEIEVKTEKENLFVEPSTLVASNKEEIKKEIVEPTTNIEESTSVEVTTEELDKNIINKPIETTEIINEPPIEVKEKIVNTEGPKKADKIEEIKENNENKNDTKVDPLTEFSKYVNSKQEKKDLFSNKKKLF